jgi:opacity protein-like surface antigen
MGMKLPPRLMAVALFVTAVFPLYSQVGPAARQGGIPLVVGAGFSGYNTDWGHDNWMEGVSAWVDFYPPHLPGVLHGLGVEAEGRDINIGRPADLSNMRQDTGLGGAIYTWDHYRNFRPYAKFLAGIGSIDFPRSTRIGGGPYSHDTFTVSAAPAGGVEFRAFRHVWVRGGYEYQFWHDVFGRPQDLNPNGFTVGLSYDFRPWRPK